MGNDLWVSGEDIVHHASVVGIEWPHCEGFAACFDAFRDAFDFLGEVVLLDGAEV